MRRLLWVFVLLLLSGYAMAQVPGCTSPPCSPNPVPCAHCSGSWTDDTGALWTVASNNTPTSYGTYTVSGSVSVPNPTAGCPGVTFTVTGNISQYFGSASSRGTTTIQWLASNPVPSNPPCGFPPQSTITYTGTIINNSCDTASGSWTNSTGATGTFTAAKNPDVPDLSPTETNATVAWYSLIPTVMLFQPTIGSSKYMAGRQVFEAPSSAPIDSCWFPGSQILPGSLSGGGWHVGFYFFNNTWTYDYVGMTPYTIEYYRNNSRVPCTVALYQAMRLYQSDTASSYTYKNNLLYWNIPDYVNYGVARDGVQAWRTWP